MPPAFSSKSEALAERMMDLGLRESDLDETLIRSAGKGGQNVSAVES